MSFAGPAPFTARIVKASANMPKKLAPSLLINLRIPVIVRKVLIVSLGYGLGNAGIRQIYRDLAKRYDTLEWHPMSTQLRQFGDRAEAVAAIYLEQKGYKILGKNYQKPWGEIDIIAKEMDVFVFVEVKANARETNFAFNPEVRADAKKMAKVMKTASLYLQYEIRTLECEWRIDIVSVIMRETKAHITHFKNVAEAFQ